MRVLMWEHFAPGGPIRVGGHHLARRFLQTGARIAWCVGPLSPINFVRSNAETKARMMLWRRGGSSLEDGAMFAYAPMTLVPYRPYPLFDTEIVHRMTLSATFPRWRRVLDRAGFDRVDLLWMSPGSPLLALLDGMPHDLSVYRMSDDTAQFRDTPRSFARVEEEVCRRVDLVVATARGLEERARSLGARRTLFLPNACDPDPFQIRSIAEPHDLAHLPRPRAIYAGAIDSWFDTGLLADLAMRMPDWQFVLLGPARTNLSQLERLGNVTCLGPRSHAELPAYLGASDAGIVPFRLTPMTHAIHPIKIYEYCAAGLPIVSTPMNETSRMEAPVRLAGDAAEFEAGLREGRREAAALREARLAFARRNTWDHRFAAVQRELACLQGNPPRYGAGGAL